MQVDTEQAEEKDANKAVTQPENKRRKLSRKPAKRIGGGKGVGSGLSRAEQERKRLEKKEKLTPVEKLMVRTKGYTLPSDSDDDLSLDVPDSFMENLFNMNRAAEEAEEEERRSSKYKPAEK